MNEPTADPASKVSPSIDEAALNYQANRSLDECPGYLAVLQVVQSAGAGERRLAAALRRDGLEIHTDTEIQYLFDLEGRFIRSGTRSEYRFRGCSHQGSRARKTADGFARTRISQDELDEVCRDAWEAARSLLRGVEGSGRVTRSKPSKEQALGSILPILRRTVAWTPERLAAEVDHFAEVYQPVPVLPPDHYNSLVLQATEGCAFNTCTFCSLYRDRTFRVRGEEEFDRHVRAALAFHGSGLYRMNRIFLGQANALVVPQPRLEIFLRTLARYVEFPDPDLPPRASWASGHPLRFLGIGSFLDAFTGLKKSAEDYDRLRLLGLRRIYLGVESGSDRLLAWLKKPARTSEMLRLLGILHEAGIRNDVILLVGAGGTEWADEHVRESLEFLATAPLEPGDRVYLSDLVPYPNTPYPDALEAIGSKSLTSEEMKEQRDALRRGARELGLQAVPYRVEPFIY